MRKFRIPARIDSQIVALPNSTPASMPSQVNHGTVAIGNGPTQELQITPYSFIGDAAFDPSLNQVYVTSNADDGVGVFYHGIIALSVQNDCTLALGWQQQIGSNDGSPTIPPITANGVVYAPTGGGSSVFAFDGAPG